MAFRLTGRGTQVPGATVVIDQQQTFAGPPIALSVGPKLEFGSDSQQITKNGERRWVIQVACTYTADPGMKAAAEVIEVTITGEDPSVSIAPGATVEFNVLRQGISAPERRGDRVIGGKAWYSAQGVRALNGTPNGRVAATAGAE
jgi:hypothetical protein